jgi:hypothetical protein
MPTIDLAELTAAVRRSQNSPDFEIFDWSAGVLSQQGGGNPDGLFRYSGHGRGGRGVQSWSIVLKVLEAQDESVSADDWWYTKREYLVYQSGLLHDLPGSIVTPECYGTAKIIGTQPAQATEGVARVWMEHVVETAPRRWQLEQYAFAARQLGLFHGAYLTGKPSPDYPWLSKGALQAWLRIWNPERGWDSPYVARHIYGPVRERVMQTWAARVRLFAALERLPQTFSHLDFMRRNLMIRNRADGQAELVAVDWEKCGIAPIGADLAYLVGSTGLFLEWEPADAQALESTAMEAYLAGLRDAGWRGDVRLARLGYLAWVGLHYGVIMSSAIAAFTADEAREFASQRLGKVDDELAASWAMLGEFALGRAGEAFHLVDELGLA